MAVDDHGLEVLKKSGEEVAPGDRSNYYIKTKVNNGAGDPVIVSGALTVSFVSGSVTVGISEVEAKVGGSPLASRKLLTITNNSTKDIYYGPTGVTPATGDVLKKGGQYVSLPVGPGVSVFLISADVGLDIRVQEFS